MKTSNKILIALCIIYAAIPLALFGVTWGVTHSQRNKVKQICQQLSERPIRVVELVGNFPHKMDVGHPGPETSPDYNNLIWGHGMPEVMEISGDTIRLEYSEKNKHYQAPHFWSVEYIIRNGEVKKLELNDWQKRALEDYSEENLREIKANFKPLTDKPQHRTYIYD